MTILAVPIFNALEASFWLLLALLTAIHGHRTRGFTPTRQFSLAVFLTGFGISDIIEIFTGAWWKPASLLVLKATCLAGLSITAAMIYRARWRQS